MLWSRNEMTITLSDENMSDAQGVEQGRGTFSVKMMLINCKAVGDNGRNIAETETQSSREETGRTQSRAYTAHSTQIPPCASSSPLS